MNSIDSARDIVICESLSGNVVHEIVSCPRGVSYIIMSDPDMDLTIIDGRCIDRYHLSDITCITCDTAHNVSYRLKACTVTYRRGASGTKLMEFLNGGNPK